MENLWKTQVFHGKTQVFHGFSPKFPLDFRLQVTLGVQDPRALPQLRERPQLPAHLLQLRHAARAAAGALQVVEGHEFQDQTSPGKMVKPGRTSSTIPWILDDYWFWRRDEDGSWMMIDYEDDGEMHWLLIIGYEKWDKKENNGWLMSVDYDYDGEIHGLLVIDDETKANTLMIDFELLWIYAWLYDGWYLNHMTHQNSKDMNHVTLVYLSIYLSILILSYLILSINLPICIYIYIHTYIFMSLIHVSSWITTWFSDDLILRYTYIYIYIHMYKISLSLSLCFMCFVQCGAAV